MRDNKRGREWGKGREMENRSEREGGSGRVRKTDSKTACVCVERESDTVCVFVCVWRERESGSVPVSPSRICVALERGRTRVNSRPTNSYRVRSLA